MSTKNQASEGLSDTLAEGIAAVMAANSALDEVEDLTDLFLDELNRIWCEPAEPAPADAGWDDPRPSEAN